MRPGPQVARAEFCLATYLTLGSLLSHRADKQTETDRTREKLFPRPWRPYLVPGIGILREAGTLHSYDAEALVGRSLHHHPALPRRFTTLRFPSPGAPLRQGRRRSRCLDGPGSSGSTPLDLDNRLVGWGLQHAIIAAAARMVLVNGSARRFAPEAGCLVHIRGLASRSTRRIDGNGAFQCIPRDQLKVITRKSERWRLPRDWLRFCFPPDGVYQPWAPCQIGSTSPPARVLVVA